MIQSDTLDILIEKYNARSVDPLDYALSCVPLDPEDIHANLVYARVMAKSFPRVADVTGTGAIGIGDSRMINYFKQKTYSAIDEAERRRMALIRSEIEMAWLKPRFMERFDNWPAAPKHSDEDFRVKFRQCLQDTLDQSYLDRRGALRSYDSPLSDMQKPKRSWLGRMVSKMQPSPFGGL